MTGSTRSQTAFLPLFAALLLALSVLAGPTESAEIARLGSIDFPNSGAAEAQEPFIRGVLLLHSFEYEDAREAFQAAREIDPDFALAYWGEAMTHNHPIWREVDQDAARAALERFATTRAERLEKAPTERERDYLATFEHLLGEGEKIDRDAAYSNALRELSARYPDDLEAKAFYALSILGARHGGRDFATYMRAGAVAEEVFAANPRHPGAVHYLIHSYDDPVHAPLGLRAARVYADIAPAASHAQHMISHIFVALGEWQDSVESNRKSFEVSRERAERKGLGVDALNYHALQWLEYSYLQLGRFDQAGELLRDMERYASESGTGRATWYHAYMRAAWVVETGTDAPGGHGAQSEDSSARILDHFASGYAAVRAGDLEAAKATYELLTRATADLEADEEASPSSLTETRVLHKSLRALLENADGQTEVALALLAEAAAEEAALPLEFGPPSIVKPSHELYGELLLAADRPDEARVQFNAALARAPRRAQSLSGFADAARAMGDSDAAARACGELASIRSGAPSEKAPLPAACSG